MFGHIDRRAAVFPAQSGALNDPHDDEQHRRQGADLGISGQEAYGEGGGAHQGDGDQKGALAPHLVPHPPEDQSAVRTEEKTGAEERQGRQQAGRRVQCREEILGYGRCQGSEDKEVIPFKGCAGR